MQFGDAIVAMQNGLKVYRPVWDDRREVEPGAYVKIVGDPGRVTRNSPAGGAVVDGAGVPVLRRFTGPDDHVGAPYFDRVAREELNADVLADDWEIRQ